MHFHISQVGHGLITSAAKKVSAGLKKAGIIDNAVSHADTSVNGVSTVMFRILAVTKKSAKRRENGTLRDTIKTSMVVVPSENL